MRVGLLEKAKHVAAVVGFDEAVRARIVHRRQHDRRLGLALAVQRDHRREIDFRQDVAVEDDDRVADAAGGVLDGAARAERRRFDHVPQRQPGLAAVAENFLDAARLIVEAQDDFVDFGDFLYEIELKLQKRPIEDRDDRLRRVNRERTQPRALAACEQNRLHRNHRWYHVKRLR